MMITSRRVLLALILAAAGSIVACDRTDEVGGLTGPQYARNAKAMKFIARGIVDPVYTCADKAINKQGGTATFPGVGVTLVVSRNAVQNPTVFCAKNSDIDGTFTVSLRAFQEGNGDPVTQFRTSVFVTLDLSSVTITNWAKVGVVYRNPDGSFESMASQPDRVSKTVTATLNHFSDYSPVEN